MSLSTGTATQLAERLRSLADYGDSKRPAADSVLAQAVADARGYAAYLDQDVAPQLANVLIVPGTSIFETADALASLIVEEAGGTPEGAAISTFPWLAVGGAVVFGLLAAAYLSQGNRRGGFLAEVGL